MPAKFFRNTRPQLPVAAAGWIGLERRRIKRAEADPDQESRTFPPDARDDFPRKARAVLEAPAERPRPRHRAEHLVPEVPVTVLDIDKLKSRALRQLGGANVVVDEPADLIVAQHDAVVIGRDAESGVENRMVIRDLRFQFPLVARAAEATAVRQLQADQKIVDVFEVVAMSLFQPL